MNAVVLVVLILFAFPSHADQANDSASISEDRSLHVPIAPANTSERVKVLLRVQVTSKGEIPNVEIKQSSGDRRIDFAALKAARNLKIPPTSQNGIAIDDWLTITFIYDKNKSSNRD